PSAHGGVAQATAGPAAARIAARGRVRPHRRELRDGDGLVPPRWDRHGVLRHLRGRAVRALELRDARRADGRRRDRRAAAARHRFRHHRDVHRDRRARRPAWKRCGRGAGGRGGRLGARARRRVERRGRDRRRPGTAHRGGAAMIWAAILSSGLATYLTRSLPFVVGYRGRVPPALSRYLEALPVAIIAALVGPAVVLPAGATTHGEIGRASCRERVEITGGAAALKKKK